jgi:hypothetical protein
MIDPYDLHTYATTTLKTQLNFSTEKPDLD